MDHNMFCFQCEQTAGCTGCTSRGVCGKDAQTAQAQDRLTGALIGLARAADTSPDAGPETWQLMIEGLFATLTNVNFDPDSLNARAGRVRAEKQRLVPDCAVCTAPCGRTGDYDLAQLWGAQEDPQPEVPAAVRQPRHGSLCLSRHGARLPGRVRRTLSV